MKRVLCYGDSLTFGEIPNIVDSIREEKRWTKILQEKLLGQFEIIEEGLSSRTTNIDNPTKEGRNGLTYYLPCLLSHAPLDYVVIMLGTNDLKSIYKRTPEEIAESFIMYKQKTLEAAEYWGLPSPHIILVVPPLVKEGKIDPSWGFEGAEEKGKQLPDLYKVVAEKMGADYVDANSIVETSDKDGVHWDQNANYTFGEWMAEFFLKKQTV